MINWTAEGKKVNIETFLRRIRGIEFLQNKIVTSLNYTHKTPGVVRSLKNERKFFISERTTYRCMESKNIYKKYSSNVQPDQYTEECQNMKFNYAYLALCRPNTYMCAK